MTQREEQQKLGRYRVPQVGELLDERYRIKGVMATGGMGMILRAEQLPMERPVAIKVLHPHIAAENPELVGRFQREVRLAKELNHPNTIRLYDFGESDTGLVYVAMEYLEGADLKELLSEQGALPVGRALEITRQMLDGLAEAHAREFIHRDLKPSNVFVTTNRRGEDLVKLLDFGIAKSLEEGRSDLTATGAVCGTPSYVAPEYLLDQSPGKAADVYAVGLMLLEMLTGRKVFCGQAPVQTLMMQIKLDTPIPDDIAASPVGRVVARATYKAPQRRYADAEQMYEAVCEVIEQVGTPLSTRRMGHLDAPDIPPERAAADTAESLEYLVAPENAETGGRRPGRLRWRGLVGLGAIFMVAVGALLLADPGPQEIADGVDRESVAAPPAPTPRDQPPEESQRARSQPTAEAEPDDTVYRFELHSDPNGARVWAGEHELGRTPVDFAIEPAELPVDLEFELDGHQPARRVLTRTSSPIIVEMLDQTPPPEPNSKRARRARRPMPEANKPQADKPQADKPQADKPQADGRRSDEGAADPDRPPDSFDQIVDRYLDDQPAD
ncbi:MAG: serine/threonine-protein kinase [Persicimonas sp.]